MSNKFDNIPVEDETQILLSVTANFGRYETLYQKWEWSGVTGESLIFFNKDLNGVSINKIQDEIRKSPLINDSSSEITTSVKKDFNFFNFNFVID